MRACYAGKFVLLVDEAGTLRAVLEKTARSPAASKPIRIDQ